MTRFLTAALSAVICIFLFSPSVPAQNKPRVSPKAGVNQIIGTTEVSISYSRPGVKNREVWGGLVPYNKVWRAGADEATKFTFGGPVVIEGKKLAAGSYSFFVIPSENSDWTLIFNKVPDQWGAFEYNESKDALRIKVKPKTGQFHEWLTYEFTDMSKSSAVVNLSWDKLRIPFKIEVKAD